MINHVSHSNYTSGLPFNRVVSFVTSLSLHFFAGARQIAKTAEKLAREKELAKVAIRKEDVDLIADEMEIRDRSIVQTQRIFQSSA